MSSLFTRMQWDLIEYNIQQEKYRREHGLVQETARAVPQPVPLSQMRRKREEMGVEAYVTERRSGKYIERRVRKYQSGGSRIRRLPYERLFDGTLVKPYVRLKDIEVDEETGEEIIYADTVRLCRDNDGRMAVFEERRKWKPLGYIPRRCPFFVRLPSFKFVR